MHISPEVYSILKKYPWPGNIRELENAIERAINLTDDDEIRPEHLPEQLLQPEQPHDSSYQRKLPVMSSNYDYKSNGYHLIQAGLKQTGGNVKRAAELLGINRRTLYRRMDKLGIDYQNFRD
ncbi:Nitrogen fixation protein VnfA [bioreactor metagenome]|uniref:Nitrogen fixation protein VnfA n=1 Tax=bioreactor metagenome TaxID=1076179 RepID=A0A645J2X7_9ZZZZ